jgi:hypothetical protein
MHSVRELQTKNPLNLLKYFFFVKFSIYSLMRMYGGPEPLVSSIDPDPAPDLSLFRDFSGLQ